MKLWLISSIKGDNMAVSESTNQYHVEFSLPSGCSLAHGAPPPPAPPRGALHCFARDEGGEGAGPQHPQAGFGWGTRQRAPAAQILRSVFIF